MRVLLLGSGGREHALAWGLARSPSVSEVIAAPGNPGIANVAELRAADIESPGEVVALARDVDADLVVVGPEAPLVAGVADALREAGQKVFGPGQAAARIEGSKRWAKALMDRAGIPTAEWRAFDAAAPAIAYLDELGPPYVVKADGLAAGKGVVVTDDRGAAVVAIEERIEGRRFGDAGSTVVIEEFLDGQECSLIAFVDGRRAVACEPAQDYKRAEDHDAGPNTGGMGSYSPVPACPPELADQIVAEVIEPMVAASAAEGAEFRGALYAGLALTSRGPRVVEFNARFGDPETQALIPRLESDLGTLCLAAASGDLRGVEADWSLDPCVSVVVASSGYPDAYETGYEISGIDEAEALDGVVVFHAGTRRTPEGSLVTAGGRVLAVSATGLGFAAARARAYEAVGKIGFEGSRSRGDIALRAEHTETTSV